MSNCTINIDDLYIASPCTVPWEQMRGDNRVRLCDDCQLKVYNIVDMTRAEAQDLIAKSEDRLCMRLYKRTDGTVLTRDCPVGVRAVRAHMLRLWGAMVTLAACLVGSVITTRLNSADPDDPFAEMVWPPLDRVASWYERRRACFMGGGFGMLMSPATSDSEKKVV